MEELVTDALVGANFAALVIVRLSDGAELEGTATVFWPTGSQAPASLVLGGLE